MCGWQVKLCDIIVTHRPYLSTLEIKGLYIKCYINSHFYFSLLILAHGNHLHHTLGCKDCYANTNVIIKWWRRLVDFCTGEILAHPSQLRTRTKSPVRVCACCYVISDELCEQFNLRYAMVLLGWVRLRHSSVLLCCKWLLTGVSQLVRYLVANKWLQKLGKVREYCAAWIVDPRIMWTYIALTNQQLDPQCRWHTYFLPYQQQQSSIYCAR